MSRPAAADPPRSRLASGERKQQIVETVLALIDRHGTEGVSAQRVADAIGVTQPAVFRHFPTKEELWLAVMDWLEARLLELYDVCADGARPPEVALATMFLGHLRLVRAHPELGKLIFSDHLRLQHPSLQARFAAIHRGYAARLRELFDRAKAAGRLGEFDTGTAATTFLCLIQGLAFQFAIARVRIALLEEGERALRLFLDGLARSARGRERVEDAIDEAKAAIAALAERSGR
jgi:AcrR family transcriptional regulator